MINQFRTCILIFNAHRAQAANENLRSAQSTFWRINLQGLEQERNTLHGAAVPAGPGLWRKHLVTLQETVVFLPVEEASATQLGGLQQKLVPHLELH